MLILPPIFNKHTLDNESNLWESKQIKNIVTQIHLIKLGVLSMYTAIFDFQLDHFRFEGSKKSCIFYSLSIVHISVSLELSPKNSLLAFWHMLVLK